MTLARRGGADQATRGSGDQTTRRAGGAALLQRLRQGGIDTVRVAWCDLHGARRGKTLVCGADPQAVAEALEEGIGMVSTILLKDSSERTAFRVFEPGALDALPGFGAANNVLLRPDPASFLELPWAPGTGWLRADPVWADGTPVAADPRGVLLRALAALADAGYGLRCGLEVEFHIHRIVDEHLAPEFAGWPAEPPSVRAIHPGYHLLSEAHADLADEALAIVRRTAIGLALPLRSLEIELGPSQFEAVFAPTDALTAADQMLLFRNGVGQALRRAGYQASFVCKPPLPHAVASGWHLHQSLVDAAGGNAMRRDAAAGGAIHALHALDAHHVLSDAGAHWLAGLLAHAAGLTALSAPTIPAYARYQGSAMAPQAAVWGRDNRGAMLRVVGAAGSAATRIENRLAEPMANPYLMIAGQISAGLDGLARRLAPPLATESPYAAAPLPQAPPLPQSLAAALQALRDDAVLQEGLGPTMATVYDTVKRQELARHAQAEDAAAWERREYFGRY